MHQRQQILRQTIPPDLANCDSWVCWRAEERGGKKTKVPYSPHGGMGKSNDSKTWGTLAEACDACDAKGLDGVGIVLVGDLIGYDLDVKDDPARKKIAEEIVWEAGRCQCYVEISPSGKGYRIFTRGVLPRAGKGGDGNWIEVYDKTSPRYLTVTGNRIYVRDGEIEECQGFVDWMHERYLEKKTAPAKKKEAESLPISSLPDLQLIEKITASAAGAEFSRLFGGDAGDDHSAADLALANILAWWTNCDAAQMDRIFRSSGLMRDKWDKKHHSDGRTYGDGTIERAIRDCVGGYDPTHRSSEPLRKVISKGKESDTKKPHQDASTEGQEVVPWQMLLQEHYDKKGNPLGIKKNAYNLGLILAHDERLQCFGHDEFCDKVGFTSPPPWNETHGHVVGVSGKWWDNADYARLQFWLAAEYDVTWGKDQVCDSMKMVATSRRFHPVRDWLNGLQWDGKPRLDAWLTLFMGAEHNAYTSLVGRLWLISAVARIIRPGCKADHVLIFEGAQGLKKSTALRVMATIDGQAWFNDTNMHLATKDSYVSLRGSWIIELAELQQLIRAETEDAKAFFTSCIDRYRPPYERDIVDYPRQCVFAGTVNEEHYLRDSTGNRRYWPVKVLKIDMDKIEAEKDQLWAEAVAVFNGGARWWPEGDEEIRLCAGEQEERQIGDSWESLVFDYLDAQTSRRLTVADILKGALGMEADKIGRREEMRLSKIMDSITDWKRGRWISGDRKIRGYEKQ